MNNNNNNNVQINTITKFTTLVGAYSLYIYKKQI